MRLRLRFPRTLAPVWRQRLQWLALGLAVSLAHGLALRAAPLAHGSAAAPGSGPAVLSFSLAAPAQTPTPTITPATPAAGANRPAQIRRPKATPAVPTPAAAVQQIQEKRFGKNTAPALVGIDVDAPILEDASGVSAPPAGDVQLAGGGASATPLASRPAAPTPPAAQPTPRTLRIPASARLLYDIKGEVKGFPYFVNGELQWVQDGQRYEARMEIRHFLLGARVQTSKGRLSDQGLEPERFGDKVKSEVAAHFVRDKGKVVFSANTPQAPLQTGAQDQLSIFMQLAALLGGRSLTTGTSIEFQAVGPRSAEQWVFTVGSMEKLSLPGGELLALYLLRTPVGGYDTKVEIWLAPTLDYLPARIRITQANGDSVDQLWSATRRVPES